MNKLKLIAILTIFITLGLIAGCSTSTTTNDVKSKNNPVTTKQIDTRGTQVGNHAPDFELSKISGEKISLDSLKGNPAVLVFWSAYCVSCEEEAPYINKLAKDFEAKGVKIVGINIGESEARTLGGIKDFGIEYDVVRDEGRKVTQKYKVLGTPTVLFLDKNGIVKYNGNELPKDSADRLNSMIS